MSGVKEILINQRKKYVTTDGTEPAKYRTYESAGINFANFTLKIASANSDTEKEFRFGGEDVMNWVLNKKRMVSLEPIVRFGQKKNLICTPINDTDEVVERWSTTGYEISIDGLLIDMEKHQYPEEQIKMLYELFSINKVGVVYGSPLFSHLNITDIYFISVNIEPLVGFEDTIRYSLQAKSISPFYYELKP